MEGTFEVNRTTRRWVAQFLDNHTLEQLNKIPDGFSNNLIWNIGHIIVTHQLLIYKLSGLPISVSDEMVEKYRKGTKPEQDVTQDEVDVLKALLHKAIDQTEKDYINGAFKNYQEYQTSTGFVLKSAKGAMHFNNFHEGVHIGMMMNIKKFI